MSGASVAAGGGTGAAPAPARKVGSIKRERRWALVGAYVALAVFVVFFLLPPFHMLITSLKSSAEIADLSGNPWIVSSPTLENYRELAGDAIFRTALWNTFVYAAMAIPTGLLVALALASVPRTSAGGLSATLIAEDASGMQRDGGYRLRTILVGHAVRRRRCGSPSGESS